MALKLIVAAGLVLAGVAAAEARDGATLVEAGIPALDVAGFSDSVPAGMPLFAALPRMAPGAEVEIRDVGTSGLVAFDTRMPAMLDPNAEIATGSVKGD
ncbi:hypothetical protein OPKNFCMD_6057 [Methylobacterium crusticola]|uniref:Uncharacterized protein n=1 Tax=Methylobacterium crusticola TaxID=1697972 RepID=A0ABQ4R793_9HYPH|nr:hypothetical protein [Methylobacterium crusticola]GJD53282.1 hypothetical protein OPKNFCMD_6057 [Methylobacterium crusticola]